MDAHGTDLETITGEIESFDAKLKGKADMGVMDRFNADLKRCALYEDFKDLYTKTVVPMQEFQE